MKNLTFLCLSLIIFSCKGEKDDNGTKIGYGIQVIVINGCQYVLFQSGGSSCTMVHAGNCNNVYHQK